MASPRRAGDRLLEVCFSLLLSAMALYGVVWIIEAIWLPLCLLALAGLAGGGLVVWLWRRFHNW